MDRFADISGALVSIGQFGGATDAPHRGAGVKLRLRTSLTPTLWNLPNLMLHIVHDGGYAQLFRSRFSIEKACRVSCVT